MKKITLTVLILLFAVSANATVLFQDNFDDHSDWGPTQQANSGSEISSINFTAASRCTGCPDGTAVYNAYFIDKAYWPDDWVGENTLQINNSQPYGGSGKSLIYYSEPYDNGTGTGCVAQGGYCSDAALVVFLDDSYQTIYVKYWVKYQSDFLWSYPENGYGHQQKLFHVSHFTTGSGYMFRYFKVGDHAPYVIPIVNGDTFKIGVASRKQSCYYPNDGCDPLNSYESNDYIRTSLGSYYDEGLMDDGSWHEMIWQFSCNSGQGNYDGIARVWMDGVKQFEDIDVAWADRGESGDCGNSACSDATGPGFADPPTDCRGWNWVAIGGNFKNPITSSHVEQWIAYDNFVIATTYAEADDTFDTGTTPEYSGQGVSGGGSLQ